MDDSANYQDETYQGDNGEGLFALAFASAIFAEEKEDNEMNTAPANNRKRNVAKRPRGRPKQEKNKAEWVPTIKRVKSTKHKRQQSKQGPEDNELIQAVPANNRQQNDVRQNKEPDEEKKTHIRNHAWEQRSSEDTTVRQRLEKLAERKKTYHDGTDEDVLAEQRQKSLEQRKRYLDNQTPEESKLRLEKEKERSRKRRARQTPEEHEQRKLETMLRRREALKNETEEQAMIRRAKDAERRRNKVANMSEEEKEARRARDVLRKKKDRVEL